MVEDDELPVEVLAPARAPSPQPSPPPNHSQESATVIDTKKNIEIALDVDEEEEDKIREHGRLYLRNLHFGVKEEDLREHFAKYSSLEEVSSIPFSYNPLCNDERQDRDN